MLVAGADWHEGVIGIVASRLVERYNRPVVLIALLLGPSVAAYWSGHVLMAHYLALGTVLAFNLCVLARPLGRFFALVPAVYAAAAMTAQLSDGVAALIIAVAAAVGLVDQRGHGAAASAERIEKAVRRDQGDRKSVV